MNSTKGILAFILLLTLLTGCVNNSDVAESTGNNTEQGNKADTFANTTEVDTETTADSSKIEVPDELPETVPAYREKRTYEEEGEESIVWLYSYDKWGNRISEERIDDAGGESVYSYVYNQDGQVQVKFWGSADRYETYQYNGDGTVKQYCWYNNGELQETREYEYDDHGKETKAVETRYFGDGETVISNDVTEHRYDDNGNEIEAISYDEEGKEEFRCCLEYDEENRVIKSYLLFNGKTDYLAYEAYIYDDNGNIVRRDIYGKEKDTFEIGSYTLYEYDAKNRCIKEETFKDGISKSRVIMEYEDLVK